MLQKIHVHLNVDTFVQESINEYQRKLKSQNQEYMTENEKYEGLKQKRIGITNKINELFENCNNMIEKENKIFKNLQQRQNQTNRIVQNVNTLKSSLGSCSSTIKSYNDFVANNKKYIQIINDNFENSWNDFQSTWIQWNVQEIIIWMKYTTKELNTENINWDEIEEQLNKRNITGQLLQEFNKISLQLIGIQDTEITNHLLSKIGVLQKTYNNDEGKVKEIPKEYLCPITKKIMIDPVMAFDCHCYDRKAIEEYLKENKKSPITGETAQYEIVFPNHKLKAEIEKYIKENNVDLEQDSNEIIEAEKETIDI